MLLADICARPALCCHLLAPHAAPQYGGRVNAAGPRTSRCRSMSTIRSQQKSYKLSIQQSVNSFFLASPFSHWLWDTSVSHSWRCIRLTGMLLISIILTVRSYRLYTRPTPVHGIVAIMLFFGSLSVGAGASFGIAAAAWLLRTAILLAQQPEDNEGHRAGGRGFDSRLCENSLEAVTDLIQCDLDGTLEPGKLAYVEFDVHETRDGELVVLHDLQRVLAASRHAPINNAVIAELAAEVDNVSRAQVQDVRWSMLQKLHLGGHRGVHIPTLRAFLKRCAECGLQRSMAVEVKANVTDEGRRAFLQALRHYKEGHCQALEATCTGLEYRPFGFLAAISFPFNWAASFGEFGSQEWRLWGRKFEEADIPVRSCVAHFIDMTSGV